MYIYNYIKKINTVKIAFVKRKITGHKQFFKVTFNNITYIIMKEWNREIIKFVTNNQLLTISKNVERLGKTIDKLIMNKLRIKLIVLNV